MTLVVLLALAFAVGVAAGPVVDDALTALCKLIRPTK